MKTTTLYKLTLTHKGISYSALFIELPTISELVEIIQEEAFSHRRIAATADTNEWRHRTNHIGRALQLDNLATVVQYGHIPPPPLTLSTSVTIETSDMPLAEIIVEAVSAYMRQGTPGLRLMSNVEMCA